MGPYLLLLIVFVNGEVADTKFALAPTEAVCKSTKADIEKSADERGADVWLSCIKFDYKPKKPIQKNRGADN